MHTRHQFSFTDIKFVCITSNLYNLTLYHLQTASDFISMYYDVVERDINQQINLTSYVDVNEDPFVYSYICHEATLAFAYALNKTIAGGGF